MSSRDKKSSFASARKRKQDATLSTVSVSTDTSETGQGSRSTGNVVDRSTNEGQLAQLSNEIRFIFEAIQSMAIDRHILRPHTDPFFDKLQVQQYGRTEESNSSTWSLMKISDKGTYKCIGITSAHLMDRHWDLLKNSQSLFIELPRALFDVGVESALFHEDYHPSVKHKTHLDVLIIVLKDVPKINGYKSSMEDLRLYPAETTTYNTSWRTADVVGKSRRDFVVGRGVERVSYDNGSRIYYMFTSFCGEKGDSGTLMYTTTDSNEKQLVGVYEGNVEEKQKNKLGYIAPVLGWTTLKKRMAQDVQTMDLKLQDAHRRFDFTKQVKNLVSDNGEVSDGKCCIPRNENQNQLLFGTVVDVVGEQNTAMSSQGQTMSPNYSSDTGTSIQQTHPCFQTLDWIRHVFLS